MRGRKVHFTLDEVRTLCGLYLFESWNLLETDKPGEVTCVTCREALNGRESKSLREVR